MGLPLFQVDAFTDRPFAGNPAGVCLLDGPRQASWMQSVAAEMNVSETAFLVPGKDGYGLRWFTPAVEVDLCGHATLASAHVLWETGASPPDRELRFATASGTLVARRKDGLIELDFPAQPPEERPLPDGLAAALGAEPLWEGRNALYYLAEVADEAALAALDPDCPAVKAAAPELSGVILTCRGAGPHDFASRMFAPQSGIDEDPVTGSSHCCLGPFWAERLGKMTLEAYQASPRGGRLRVEVRGERVGLLGQAVTVFRAELADGGE